MNVRVDKNEFGNVPIAHVMGFDRRWFPDLTVAAPPFPITRERATERLRARFDQLKGEQPAALWVSRDIVRSDELTLLYGELAKTPDAKGSWVAFVDLRPGDPFAHPCAYWFVDANESVRAIEAEFGPLDLRSAFLRVA